MRKHTDTNKTLSEDQLNLLKTNALGILSEARKTVLNRFPFYGSIAMSLDLIPVRDCRIATMATDGKAIYCDIDFLSTLSNDDKIFILCHEILHCVMLHLLRREGRDHELFNVATDMEVNNILRADGMSVPNTAILSDKYGFQNDLSAEQYYELLLQRQQYQKSDSRNGSNGGGSAGDEDGDDSDGDDESQDGNGSGNKEGKLEGQFDKHIYKGEKVEDKGDENQQDRYGKVGYDPDFQPNVTQSAVEQVREAAVAAAQMIERQCGELPGHLQKIVKGLLEPKLDWKEVLASFLTKHSGESNRTWNRCNRRFVGSKIYLPSTYSEGPHIGIVIDTSGSVYEQLNAFLSEVNGIVKCFDGYNLHIVQCDASVKSYDKYDEYEPLDLEHTDFKACGGGGTRLMPGINYFNEHDCDIDCIVVFTDTYCEDMIPENAPAVPVLWIATTKGPWNNIKFGEVVEYTK